MANIDGGFIGVNTNALLAVFGEINSNIFLNVFENGGRKREA